MPGSSIRGLPRAVSAWLAAAVVVGACASSGGGASPPAGDASLAADAARPGDALDPENVFYVATTGADWNAGDDPAHPFRTVAHAITRAAACAPAPCSIRIAEGVYTEVVMLAPGVDLEGGWAPGFVDRDVVVHAVVLTSEDAVSVHAEALDATTTLDGLTIRGANLELRTDGASSTALRLRDSGEHLRLRNVRVEGGRGARGRDGEDGSLVACQALGGAGGGAFDCGGDNGGWGDAGGDPSMAGDPGTPGGSNCPSACPLVGGDGVSPGVAGGNGANGPGGASGVPGDDLDGAFAADGDTWVGDVGVAATRGGHGTGGSGGGPGGSKRFRACFGCGTLVGGRGGDGAPGGCGGDGGTSGGPGGASFGVVVIRSTLLIDDVGVVGGLGGAGGAGGDGHPGSPGGTDGSVGRQGAPSQQCGLITYHAGAGAPGGIGGHGGHGGGGAGGVGGPSIAVALVGGGVASFGEPGQIELTVGTAGPGGVGGTGAVDAPDGPAGLAADLVTY